MDHSSAHGSGGAFRPGGLGRGGSGGGGSGKESSGSGIGGDSSSAIGGGGASADAWTRLASSGVEDDLVYSVSGAGAGGGGPGSGPGGMPYGHFLDACFLCRKPIASNRDIFMYRGDIPFCSEECRREQMDADEELERKEKSSSKKLSARPAASLGGEVESPPRPPKTRAGSILAG